LDQGEPNAPDAENPNEDANMVADGEEDDDDSFLQVASKVAKKGDGFDGFGTPDPFNQNDDDQVDHIHGEPNAPDAENPNEEANTVTDGEEDDDDSFLQVASKVAKKGDGTVVTKTKSSAAQSPEEMEYLIATFQETGCPNPNPSNGQLSWWHEQNQEKVLLDMFKICKANEGGHPNRAQRKECCGEEDCSHIGCVKQDAYQVNDDEYVDEYVV